MSQWSKWLTGARARTGAIGLYVVCVAGLIMAYLSVSLAEVEYAAFMRAEPALEVGRPNAMRGLVLNAPLGRTIIRGELSLRLIDKDDKPLPDAPINPQAGVEIAHGQIAPSGYFHLRATVPDEVEPGSYRLRMHVKIPDGGGIVPADDPGEFADFMTDVPVEVLPRSIAADYWPEATERLPADKIGREDDANALKSSEGPIRIDLLPGDGQVARGLKSVVYLRTSLRETGEPVSARVNFEKVEGISQGEIPESVQTDEIGLARIEITATTDLVWTLAISKSKPSDEDDSSENKKSSAKLRITTVPSQVSLHMNGALAVPGRPVDGRVHSLFRDGGLMVDLYRADDWVDARAYGVGSNASGVRVDIPDADLSDERIDLYRVQVYRSIYGVGGAWDVEYLVGAPDDSLAAHQRAARALAAHLAAHTDDAYFDRLAASDLFKSRDNRRELRGWIDAMAEALPRRLDVQAALINSREPSRKALEARVDEIQAKLKILTAIALLIGLAGVGFLVLRGVGGYRAQNRMLQDVELEMEPDDPAEDDELSRTIGREDLVVGVLIFMVVATLALFTLGLLMLLSYF
jgi:hypothetical protein